MAEAKELIERVFDEEAKLVVEWIAMDPEYTDHRFDFEDAYVCGRRETPESVRYAGVVQLPTSLVQEALREVTPSTRTMADRFQRRAVLRRDDYEVPGIGRVAAFVSSQEDVTNPANHPWVGHRFVVGPAKPGLRILRVDVPCLECFATAGPFGAGCGWRDELSGQSCARGWISRGGVALDLAAPVATERHVRPKDARWHAWYDG